TQDRPSTKSTGRIMSSATEARLAFEHGVLDLHTPLMVRIERQVVRESPGTCGQDPPKNGRIETTVGRLILNEVLPKTLGYHNYVMTKEAIKQLIAENLDPLGAEMTAQLEDQLKRLGFTYATRSSISFALSDIEVPPKKRTLLAEADAEA